LVGVLLALRVLHGASTGDGALRVGLRAGLFGRAVWADHCSGLLGRDERLDGVGLAVEVTGGGEEPGGRGGRLEPTF